MMRMIKAGLLSSLCLESFVLRHLTVFATQAETAGMFLHLELEIGTF